MNKYISLCLILSLFSCDKFVTTDRIYRTTAKIYLINESSVVVRSSERLNYILQPGDTIINIEPSYTQGGRPSINEYFLPFNEHRDIFKYDTDEDGKCEYKIWNLKYYENKKEVEDSKFEFTFRFTDEKKNQTLDCL